MPRIIFGSKVILKLMDRFPVINTTGAAVLGWVAADVLITDQILALWITVSIL